MTRLKDKISIVTGSGAGIGKSIAETFAENGATVVCAEINPETGKETVESIKSNGGNAKFVQTDTSDHQSIKDMVSNVLNDYSRIDILVNNAARFVFGSVEEITIEDWNNVFAVNVIGYANCIKEVLPSMKDNSAGSIVNIASVSAFIAQPSFVPYNSSKGAVLQLTRCCAMDLAPYGVRVNAVCPGAVKTQATDRHIEHLGLDKEESYIEFGNAALLKRMGNPKEIAYGTLFMASDEASYVTGEYLVVDGGLSVG